MGPDSRPSLMSGARRSIPWSRSGSSWTRPSTTSTRGGPRTTGPRASSSSHSRRWSPPLESSRTSSRRRKSWWRTCKPEKPCKQPPKRFFQDCFFPQIPCGPRAHLECSFIQTQQTIISISSSQLPVTVSRPKPSSSQQSLVLTNNACNKTCICSLLQKSNHRGRQDLKKPHSERTFLPYYENKNEHISFYHPKNHQHCSQFL